MNHFIRKASARERRILLIGGIIAALILFTQAVVIPAINFRQGSRTAAQAAQATLQQMRADAGMLKALQRSTPDEQVSAVALSTWIAQSANKRGIRIARIRPIEGGGLDLWLTGIPADRLHDWLLAMHDATGGEIVKLTLSTAGEGGLVDAQIALAGGAGHVE